MNALTWALQWPNLIFLLPLVFAGLLIVAQLLGVGHGGDHDFEAEHDVDMDHDVDHDVHVDGHDTDHDHDHDQDHDQGGRGSTSINQVLSILGVGRVPLTVVLVSFFVIFGAAGLAVNQLFGSLLYKLPILSFASAGAGFMAASLLTRYSSMFFGWIMPKSASFTVENEDLVGMTGVALHDINREFGKVILTDPLGNSREVRCRSVNGNIPRGSPVVLMEYDPTESEFLVSSVNQPAL